MKKLRGRKECSRKSFVPAKYVNLLFVLGRANSGQNFQNSHVKVEKNSFCSVTLARPQESDFLQKKISLNQADIFEKGRRKDSGGGNMFKT